MGPQDTESLSFRELTTDDFGAIHAYASDPEAVQFMVWGPNTLEQTSAFIAECERERLAVPRIGWTFVVVRKTDGRLIGTCALHVVVSEINRDQASLGYILRRDAWGFGYATEAAKALIAFGFGELRLHRIWATCRPANQASANVMRKAGMEQEGHLRDDLFVRGEWQDSLFFGIVNDG